LRACTTRASTPAPRTAAVSASRVDYGRVHRLKRAHPDLPVAINGGIRGIDEAAAQLIHLDRQALQPRLAGMHHQGVDARPPHRGGQRVEGGLRRVQDGRFGACLMREPALVGEGVAAMKAAVAIPVTPARGRRDPSRRAGAPPDARPRRSRAAGRAARAAPPA
jgi:hypothetical protein